MKKYVSARFIPGEPVHVIAKAVGKELLFLQTRDYHRMKRKLEKYIFPFFRITAWNFLNNHIHLVLIPRYPEEIKWKELYFSDYPPSPEVFSDQNTYHNFWAKQISKLLISHTSYINKSYERGGSLFRDRFYRFPLQDDTHFRHLILYVISNAEKHKIVPDFTEWNYGAWHDFPVENKQILDMENLNRLFGSIENLKADLQEYCQKYRQENQYEEIDFE